MRIDPNSEENQAATRQHEREVFALQRMAKQDAELTDQEMQLSIAEAVGWTYEKREHWPKRRPKQYDYILQAPDDRTKVLPEYTVAHANPETERIIGLKRVPDYLNDLNACHEAEQTLSRGPGEEWNSYAHWLSVICERPIHATAKERAEAFVRTIAARAEREAKP